MMYRHSARLLFVALAAAACADSTGPAAGVTEAILTRDVARDVAEATAQDLVRMTGEESLIGMPLAVNSQQSTSVFANCTWNPSARGYSCPVITTPDGLTLTRFFSIFADDTTQQAYDAVATDSIGFGGGLAGTLTRPDRTVWLSHSRLLMVTGLGGAETQRSWHGGGTRDDSAHVQGDGVMRTTRIVSSDVFDNIVYKLPRATFPFPQSGTITHDVAVSSTVPNGTEVTNRSGTRQVVVTFNGTQFASVMVGSTACTLDLVTRAISCT